MHRLTSATLLRVFALAVTVSVLGCKKKEAAYNEPAASTTAVAPPAATSLRVADIKVGKGLNADKTLKNETSDFGVRDTIYVSVKTDGSSTGAQLAAKWTFQGGQTVNQSSQNIAPAGGEATNEFHIQKASAWPKGNYKVEITLDGASAGTKDFTIK